MTSPIRKRSLDEAKIAKAAELIGRFFYHWGSLEYLINTQISRLFGVDELEGSIITANIAFRDKLNIIHTALIWEGRSQPEEWKRRARKTAARVGRLSNNRNFLAHTTFYPTEDDFVCFPTVEAKGTFNISRSYWGPADFECKYELIKKAHIDLETLGEELRHKKAIIEALLKPSPPSAGLFGIRTLGPQYLPPQSPLGWVPAPPNPEINPQSDPDQPE